MGKYYIREKYLSKSREFYDDTDMIKVITGVRRCGKSSLMEMVCSELKKKGVPPENIIYIHLDKRPFKSIRTYEQMEELIDNRTSEVEGHYGQADSAQKWSETLEYS